LNPRDLLTLLVIGAVVVIGGFAAADAIRGNPGPERSSAPTVPLQTSPSRLPGPQPQPDAPPGWPQGVLRGTLTFTDARDCSVRVVGLAGGRERPVAHFAGDCSLWAPPIGQRFAYGLGPSSGDGLQPFRIADLNHPNFELGGYRALFGVVIWSPDGQRVAWCGRDRTGFDLEIGGQAHRLPHCPSVYTPDDEIAYALGNKLVTGSRTLVTARGGITYAHYGADGSLVVVEDGRWMARYDAQGRFTGRYPAPEGRTPILSPRNCAALFPPLEGTGPVEFVSLGCFAGEPPESLSGQDAAWSPDGNWIALAQANGIVFQRITPRLTVRWPAQAAELVWRPD
jgi:hypothetical protein